MAFICALNLAFTVISAGQAKLTDRITEDIHAKYLAKEKENASNYIPLSPASQRQIIGVLDIVCGLLLLVPSLRSTGAAVAFVLLSIGVPARLRSGMSLKPTVVMMALSTICWLL